MNDLEITFEREPDVEQRDLIRKTLRALVDPANVPHAHVIRLIGDGRSGATVFEVSLRKGQEDRRWVVKVGPQPEMENEVERYKAFIESQRTVACAPIVEHTPTAVAYQHVADFAGVRTEATPTLEEVVREACRGDEVALQRVERVLSTLFVKLGGPFYDRRQDLDTASLRSFNPRLGPDLRLQPERRHAIELSNVESIFDITTGATPCPPAAGFHLEAHTVDGVSVDTGLGNTPVGRVAQVRFAYRQELLQNIPYTNTPVAADPSSGLRKVLTNTRFGTARSIGHGDLNPRNILLVGNDAYVIDFAETREGLPLFWDPAWLETGLMRDVFFYLTHADLVELQRVLALACRLRGLVHDPDELEAACTGLVPDRLQVPVTVLIKLRWQAMKLHGGDGSWENYLALLYFSAYRTLKWKNQPPAALRATHAVLAVCSEWLVSPAPFECWDGTSEALAAVEPLLDLAKPEAIKLAANLMKGNEPEHVVTSLSAKLAVLQFHRQALDVWMDLAQIHDLHIELSAVAEDVVVSNLVEHLAERPAAVLVGDAGSGKSRTLLELTYQLAHALVHRSRAAPTGLPTRMPWMVEGARVRDIIPEALKLGAVHLLVDDATEDVLAWAKEFHDKYPRTPILVAMREAPQNTDWPVFHLLPITEAQALEYVTRPVHQLGDPQKQALREIITARLGPIDSPALLRMAIRHAQRNGNIKSIEEVYGRFFAAGYGEDHDAHRMMVELAALNTASTEEIATLARSFEWRNTALLAARVPETARRVVEAVIDAVWTDDPRFTAELLAADAHPSAPLIDEFVLAQRSTLADADAGDFNHQRAAVALCELGAVDALTAALIARQSVPQVLQALDRLWWHRTSADERPARERALQEALGHVLSGDHPAEIKNAVLDSIADLQLSGLELVIAELVSDPASALKAADTLLHLGVVRTKRIADLHSELCRTRVHELGVLLPTLSNSRDIRIADDERGRRLNSLNNPSTLMEYRHSFGIAEAVTQQLGEAPAALPNLPEISPDNVEELALHVQHVAAEDRLEGLRLGWKITRLWQEQQVPQRLRWPWLTLMTQLRGSSEELSALIEEDDAGRELGILALSCRDYHRTAARRPRITLSPEAASALLDAHEHDGAGWALAVAAAGLTDSLPRLITMIEKADSGVTTVASGQFGEIDVNPLDDVRTTTASLARDTPSAAQVHELLRGGDCLVGLAYLGDWVPLISTADDRVLAATARNALNLWAPGPHTPSGLAEPGATARWFDDALTVAGLSPRKRSLLGQLRAAAERKDGHLVERRVPDQEGKGIQPMP